MLNSFRGVIITQIRCQKVYMPDDLPSPSYPKLFILALISSSRKCKEETGVSDEDFDERRRFLLSILKHVEEIHGRTRFQKMVFLAQKELSAPELFPYKMYHYGPYSWDLTETIERMISRGEIVEKVEEFGDVIRYSYTPSEEGKKAVDGSKELDPESLKVMKTLSDMPLSMILDYVYRTYLPERSKV